MNTYRVWQVKRGETVTGPFPENLILQHIMLGRIHAGDLISVDGHFWQSFENTPEILEQLRLMVGEHMQSTPDPEWHAERLRAILRHADERKRPDPRSHETSEDTAEWAALRSGGERRNVLETVEQHHYRETVADVDQWLQSPHPDRNITAVILFFIALLVAWMLYLFGSQQPLIDIGLRAATCDAQPVNRVDWHGCDKSGDLLAGADLRDADLRGTQLSGANLTYANLKGARVDAAVFDGAKLAGTIWIDGRRCAADSVGSCR